MILSYMFTCYPYIEMDSRGFGKNSPKFKALMSCNGERFILLRRIDPPIVASIDYSDVENVKISDFTAY